MDIFTESALRLLQSSSCDVCPYVCIKPAKYLVSFPCYFFKTSHWLSDHMIRSSPLIGLWELCLGENSEEVYNQQSPHEKMCSWRLSELCLLDENSSIICNLLNQMTNVFLWRRQLKKKYWCYNPHRSRDSVPLVCGILVFVYINSLRTCWLLFSGPGIQRYRNLIPNAKDSGYNTTYS